MTPTTNPTPQDKGGEGMPDKRALLSKLIDAAAAYTFSREMFPIAGFAERIEERGFELAEAYRSFARADAFTILDEPEETARLKERVRVLEEALEKIDEMPYYAGEIPETQIEGLRARYHKALGIARSALHTPEVGE